MLTLLKTTRLLGLGEYDRSRVGDTEPRSHRYELNAEVPDSSRRYCGDVTLKLDVHLDILSATSSSHVAGDEVVQRIGKASAPQ